MGASTRSYGRLSLHLGRPALPGGGASPAAEIIGRQRENSPYWRAPNLTLSIRIPPLNPENRFGVRGAQGPAEFQEETRPRSCSRGLNPDTRTPGLSGPGLARRAGDPPSFLAHLARGQQRVQESESARAGWCSGCARAWSSSRPRCLRCGAPALGTGLGGPWRTGSPLRSAVRGLPIRAHQRVPSPCHPHALSCHSPYILAHWFTPAGVPFPHP